MTEVRQIPKADEARIAGLATASDLANVASAYRIGHIVIFGFTSDGDDKGGTFYWDSASSLAASDDVVVPANSPATGRWRRVNPAGLKVELDKKLSFADFYSDLSVLGNVPSTSANLTTTTPSQTLYVGGSRIAIASQAHTYGASTTTYIDATPAGAFVYTTSATPTAGNLRLFSVVTSGTAVTAVNDLRPRSPFESYITGLTLSWASPGTNANNISVSPGAAWIQSLNKVVSVSTSLSPPSATGLTASTWYWVYLYVDANGQAQVELVTTVPGAAYRGSARSKSTDTSRRMVGGVRTDSTGRIMPFVVRSDTEYLWSEADFAAPYRLINGVQNASRTLQDLSSLAPPLITQAILGALHCDAGAVGSAAISFYLATTTHRVASLQMVFTAASQFSHSTQWITVLPTTPSVYFTTANYGWLDVLGYRITR